MIDKPPAPGNSDAKLKNLSTEDGLDLLRGYVPDAVKDFRDQCVTLIERVEGLPLTLHVAGRILKRRGRTKDSTESLLVELCNSSSILPQEVPSDLVHFEGANNQTKKNIFQVLTQSTEGLDFDQKLRFASLSFSPRSPSTLTLDDLKTDWSISREHANNQEAWDQADPQVVANELVDLGLLDFNEQSGRYELHDLMANYAGYLADKLSVEKYGS